MIAGKRLTGRHAAPTETIEHVMPLGRVTVHPGNMLASFRQVGYRWRMKHLLLTLLAVAAIGSPLFAQTKIELLTGDTVQSVLEKQVGQPIDLRMKSGEKLVGKLEKVAGNAAHLSNLAGAEFYDAIVNIEDISAVVVKARGK